jgi:hypothetical protein
MRKSQFTAITNRRDAEELLCVSAVSACQEFPNFCSADIYLLFNATVVADSPFFANSLQIARSDFDLIVLSERESPAS